ncbi:MAG: DUF4258 domain-containing protein [Candidatus Uhrbacteria bacterium]|nr:DUF4258 domain-containing protein [Candidatus Uhrbacteria bacterium]
MEVIFTRHAKARMRWRGITQNEVMQAIEHPDRTEHLGSDRFHFFHHIGKRYLRVTWVLEERKRVIISVVDKND